MLSVWLFVLLRSYMKVTCFEWLIRAILLRYPKHNISNPIFISCLRKEMNFGSWPVYHFYNEAISLYGFFTMALTGQYVQNSCICTSKGKQMQETCSYIILYQWMFCSVILLFKSSKNDEAFAITYISFLLWAWLISF